MDVYDGLFVGKFSFCTRPPEPGIYSDDCTIGNVGFINSNHSKCTQSIIVFMVYHVTVSLFFHKKIKLPLVDDTTKTVAS